MTYQVPTTGKITRHRAPVYQDYQPPVVVVEHQHTQNRNNTGDLVIPVLSLVIILQFAMLAVSLGFSAQSLSRVSQLETVINSLVRE